MYLGANTFVVSIWPHGSPQRAKHNARDGGNIGRGPTKGRRAGDIGGNGNKKGNCVIYSAEQGASVSSVCTHR